MCPFIANKSPSFVVLSVRLLIGSAVVVLLTACNPTPPDQQALEAYASAVAFYQDGRFDPAAALLTEITTDHPDFHQARMLQGRILFLRAQYDRAAEVLAELERSYPSYPEA